MNKIFKRVVSVVAAIAVAVTMVVVFEVPKATVASAATVSNFADLKSAIASGGTITITSDITFTSGIEVTNNVTIKSQGAHTIKRGSSFDGYLFSVSGSGNLTFDGSSGTLTVDGGAVWSGTENSVLGRGTTSSRTVNGGLVAVKDNAVATLKSGTIFQNNCSSGRVKPSDCTLKVNNSGILNIEGSVIRNNKGRAGAIATYYNSTLNITSGEIYGNYGDTHGGVMQIFGQDENNSSVIGMAKCNISGGSIHNNLTTGVGGAIAVSDYSSLSLSGNAEIYGNKTTDYSKRGGGVGFIDSNTTLNISGNVKIYDNINSSGKANNLAIGTKNNIIKLGTLSSGAKIGVTYNPGSVNTSSSFAETNSKDYSSCFFSDTDGYFIEYKSQGLYLMKACTTHSWNSGTVTTAATCTAKGEKTYTCTVCGATKTEVVDATGHSWGTAWSKDETQHWHVCTKCGALGTKTAHTWNSGTVTKDPTCTATGVKTYTCSTCGATKTEDIAVLGHSWSSSWTTDGNNHWHTCTRSGCTSVGSKAAHSGGTATCQTQATCSVCGQKYGSVGAHNYSTAWSKDDTNHWHTCTNSGCTQKSGTASHTFAQKSDGTNHWQECSVCGYKKDELRHTWNDGVVTTEPTCTTQGVKTYTCTECGKTKTENIATIAHNYDMTIWVNDGTNHWHKCTGCGDKKDTAAHSYGDWTLTSNPTLTATGTAKHTCSICGYEQTESVLALTNTNVWTKDNDKHVDPTEEAEGKDVYTSEYGEVTVVIPELEHVHNNLTHIDEVPATETTEGVKEHWHCRCGKDFLDEDGTQEATVDDLRIGRIQKEVQASENVPKPEIATSGEDLINAALTEEDKNEVQQGKDIKIILKVEDATESTTDDDKTAVTEELNQLSRYKLGQYLDVTLLKQIGEEQQKITTTSALIKITFEIPSAFRGKPKYSVIRVHDGVATVLDDLDSDPNTVTIETDKFSTYALTYKEKAFSGGSGGGSSDTSDDTSGETSDDTLRDTSDDTSSDTSDNTSSDTESSPSGDSGSDTASSGSTSSGDESNHIPSNSGTSDGNNNPATGIAVSFIPLAAAAASIVITAKRGRK